jgi:hypothetical protein
VESRTASIVAAFPTGMLIAGTTCGKRATGRGRGRQFFPEHGGVRIGTVASFGPAGPCGRRLCLVRAGSRPTVALMELQRWSFRKAEGRGR